MLKMEKSFIFLKDIMANISGHVEVKSQTFKKPL